MRLEGKRIAVLAEDNFEDLELWYPLIRMREEGADVSVVGMRDVETYHGKHGLPVEVDVAAQDVSGDEFDAVIIPGGYAPDHMRRHPPMIEFVRRMLDLVRRVDQRGGVVAMICHAGWVPISAGIVRGRQVTSVSAIRDDLQNAGANWVDQEVVVDKNLISSRYPDDLPAFCRAIIAALV